MGYPHNPARRRYVLRVAVAMAAYIVTLAAAVRFVGGGAVTGPLAYLLALLPGLSVAGVFWAVGRLLVRQVLVASGLTLTVATIWGFLENLRLVAHVDAFYIAVLFFFGLGVGSCYNWLTLRASGER